MMDRDEQAKQSAAEEQPDDERFIALELPVDDEELEASDDPWVEGWVDMETLASYNLKMMRKSLGLSQQDIANALAKVPDGPKLHQTQIAKIERGERPWRLNEAGAIAAAMGIHFTDLFTVGPQHAADGDFRVLEARLAMRSASLEEEAKRAELIEAKRKRRAAEAQFVQVVASLGRQDADAIQILQMRYFIEERKRLEDEAGFPDIDAAWIIERNARANDWAKQELARLTDSYADESERESEES